MDTFMALAMARYSLKSFDGTPVEAEKLQKILEAGNIAPTAKNSQAHRIYVCQSEEALKKASEATVCTYGASTILLFTYKISEAFTYPNSDGLTSGPEDASIVATHIMLQAAELGVGSCWVNFFDFKKCKEIFALPEDEEPVLIMPLGYPTPGAGPLPNHTIQKPLDQTVKYL